MFNDYAWVSQRHTQQARRLEFFLEAHNQSIVIEIGAGTGIPTVRYFSERFAPNLIRINPREHALPSKGGIALATNAEMGIQSIYQIFMQ